MPAPTSRPGWTPSSWSSRCPGAGRSSTPTCASWPCGRASVLPPAQVTYTWVPAGAEQARRPAGQRGARRRGARRGRGRPAPAPPSCSRWTPRRPTCRRRRGPASSGGTPVLVRRRRRCCCATARPRTPSRSGSAGRVATTPSCPRRASSRCGGCRATRRRRWRRRRARLSAPSDQQTAQAVGDLLGCEVREVDGFRECAFGDWEGLTFDQVRAGWPDELAEWLGDPAVAPPGGESFVDVRKRVRYARVTRCSRATRAARCWSSRT